MNKKIVIIGGGVIETDENNYYSRSQLIEYLTGFHAYYSDVRWSVRLANTHQYKSRIDNCNLTLDIINKDRETIFSLKGILGQLKHYWYFFHNLDEFTDVIVSNLSLTSLPYVLIARFRARKVVFYLGSDPRLTMKLRSDSLYGKAASLFNYLVVPITLMTAHGVLVRGHTTFIQSMRWNKNTILSNPLISYKYFRNIMADKAKLLRHDSLEILYVGKLEKNKGVHVLIEALGILAKKYPKTKTFRLNIVGSGIMEQELRDITRYRDIAEIVHFHEFIDDSFTLASIFARSDLFIVPTVYSEGFPRVIDEAMASGLPVICSMLGGMKDGLKDDEVFFVDPGNAEELAFAIAKIMDDEGLREKLHANSVNRAKKILQQSATEQHAMFLADL